MAPHDRADIAILGCGFMGIALLEGWLRQGPQGPTFALAVKSRDSVERLRDKIKEFPNAQRVVSVESSDAGLMEKAWSSEILVLACPPNQLSNLLMNVTLDTQRHFHEDNVTFISLLAGVSKFKIVETLQRSATEHKVRSRDSYQVARVIPSLGARIGQSVSIIAGTKDSTLAYKQYVDTLFGAVGLVQHVPEEFMNSATALGAVCHALAVMATDTAGDASAAEGFPRDIAVSLAAKCFASCGSLLDSGMTSEQCKAAMAVPRGITINAFLNLDKSARSNIADSTRKAIEYARQMA